MKRLAAVALHRVGSDARVLVLCGGDGLEGSVLADLGFGDVTVSDITASGVKAALARDTRLNGIVLNAERTELADRAFDIVVVQDGLHHLQSPIGGFTEMLRVARVAAVFLEPHDSVVGRILGTAWEREGDVVNYVFRWSKRLVADVANSYLGPDSCDDHSVSFWHHNIVLEKLGRLFGGGRLGLTLVKVVKGVLDGVAGRVGNQLCGIIVKR